ncbi:MAG: choline/carnitine O-acyltransferase [Verrucomicrobia bacterium]|nr:choline/carnitine O-acyltransferase [Verrucomicrobiota bacterium]
MKQQVGRIECDRQAANREPRDQSQRCPKGTGSATDTIIINEVPSHPTRRFRDVLVAIGERNIKNRASRLLYLVATGAWRRVFRTDTREQYIFQEFAAGRDGFRPKYWIFKSFFYLDYLATFVMTSTGERDPARMAAQVLHGALSFREDVIRNTLEPEFEKGAPLDMAIYRKLFSRVAVTTYLHRRFVQEDVDFAPTDYVVVCVRGFLYRLPCLQEGGAMAYTDLQVRIAAILNHANARAERAEETPGLFGLLTVFVNRKHGKLFQALAETNAATLRIIDEALFTLAIDLEARPETSDAALRAINNVNYLNRDNRRSMYLVVTGNGRAGVVVNPHTGVGGMVSARFTEYLYQNAKALQQQGDPKGADQCARFGEPVEPLVFSVSKAWEASLLRTKAIVESRFYPPNAQTVYTVHGVGHADFRARNISSDAAFHCALNLAYLRCFGKIPTTGSFISLRTFRHGDIWRYVSSTEAMNAFLRNPCRETMRAALDAHRKLVKTEKTAENATYHAAMMMLKLVSEFRMPFVAVPTLLMIMSLFIRDFRRRFLLLDVWASQIPTKCIFN